jgi:transglutaminase-like putative cysteine protease
MPDTMRTTGQNNGQTNPLTQRETEWETDQHAERPTDFLATPNPASQNPASQNASTQNPASRNGSAQNGSALNPEAATADDYRGTDFALAAMASAVFIGSQLLAHASVGVLRIWDLLVTGVGTALMAWLYREQLRGQPMIRKLFVQPKAQRLLATPEVLILPMSLALLSVVPTIERQGHSAIGLSLRLAIGIAVVASVKGHVASWLAMAAIITMVFHPWDHPLVITAIFSGLALLVLGLANLARKPNHRTVTGRSSLQPRPTFAPNTTQRHGLSAQSMQRRRRQHVGVFLLIALAIGGAALLEPTARKLAWRSGESEFGQREAASSLVSRGGTFTALSRSSSLELAYRPTRSNDVVLRVYTYARSPVFLRTQTFDTWTGRTWTESSPPQREEAVRIGLWDARPFGADRVNEQFELNTYNPEAAARGLVRTVVQAQTKLNGVVPVPTEALGAIWMLDGADQTNQFLSSTMFWRTDGTASSVKEKGASPIYTVLHDTRAGGPIDEALSVGKTHPEWLSLGKVSPAVQQLAKDIVGPAATSAEKVERIRAWMTKNVSYNLTAKDPGRGADPIDYLLFTSKEGSCTHFATATAALLRSVGVPARISTGFVAQEQPRISQYVVRGRDAHAWAEVPLVSGDWLQVDTTIMAKEVFPPESSNRGRYALAVLALAAFAGLLLGAKLIKRSRRQRGLPKTSVLVTQMTRLAHRLGMPVPPDCSTLRLANALDARLSIDPRSPLDSGANESARARRFGAAWVPGTLGAFGQRLEAASFGSQPIDLSDGPRIVKAASRRARSQRWDRRWVRLGNLCRRITRR